jgi:hypothetical protein
MHDVQVLTVAASKTWSCEQTGCFTRARCRHEHQSWRCEKLDVLRVLTVAPSIHHGAAKNWMIYKC